MDVLSNELFINLLSSSYSCCLLVSEENETVIEIDAAKQVFTVYCDRIRVLYTMPILTILWTGSLQFCMYESWMSVLLFQDSPFSASLNQI